HARLERRQLERRHLDLVHLRRKETLFGVESLNPPLIHPQSGWVVVGELVGNALRRPVRQTLDDVVFREGHVANDHHALDQLSRVRLDWGSASAAKTQANEEHEWIE